LVRLYGLTHSFDIEWLPVKNRRLFTWAAVQRARQLRGDVIYTWMIQSAVFAAGRGMRVVFEAHEPPSGTFGPAWYHLFTARPARKRIAVITRALQSILEKDYGALPAGTYVLAPNGVELERFAAADDPATARRQIGLRELPTVLCAGHLYAGRGADLFLALAQNIASAQFVWVGGKPEDVETWKARAAHLPNVTFTGFVENTQLPAYLAAADILLMPYGKAIAGSSGGDSASVASPMKMFEYMAACRAIVTSALPVIREVLDDASAVFCPPDDLAAWTAAIASLLAAPERRATLAAHAARSVGKYAWLARAETILKDFV
jgi:glycosyltransferase involved in cell wall biosynthesis